VSPLPCQTNLRNTNHRGHKFPPSVSLLSFKTPIKWRPVLTATACFLSVFFQLQQYSRKHSSFSAQRVLWWQKLSWFFLAFSLTFVDFPREAIWVKFHSGVIFLDQSQFLVMHSNQWDCFVLYRKQITSNGCFSCLPKWAKAGFRVIGEDFEIKRSCMFFYCIKQIDSIAEGVTDVLTTSSVIYYWTDARQHGIYLLNRLWVA